MKDNNLFVPIAAKRMASGTDDEDALKTWKLRSNL